MKKAMILLAIRNVVAILLFMGLVSVLCSCGHPAKSESDILSDLQEIDDFFQNYNLSIDSSEVLKRQTNQNDKTDYVWIEFNASNDDFSYYASYELMYVLYNDGWSLEDWDRDSQSYYGLHPESVEQAAADEVMSQQGYDEFTFNGRYEDQNRVDFNYTAYKEEYYVQSTYDVTLSYYFYPGSLWNKYEMSEDILSSEPDVLGEWVYDDGYKRYSVNFISVDLENETAELDVRLENYDTGSSETTLDSDGPMSFDINRTVYSSNEWYINIGKTYYVGSIVRDYISVWFHGGSESKLTHSGVGSGVSIDGYWLIKQDSVDKQSEGSTNANITGSYSVTEESGSFTVTGEGVRIRTGPGTDYDIIGVVNSGDKLTVSGKSGDWYQVSYQGQTGYISADYATKD